MLVYSTLLIISLACQMQSVLADQPFARYNSGYQLLMNDTRIYCYSGGYAKVVHSEVTVLPDHYYLDISQDFVVANGYNGWKQVVDPPDFITEATFAYTSVKLSDTSVLISGGTGINNNIDYMKNQTTIYHADQNRWETIQSTPSFPQNYYGSGVLTQNNTIVFYGGGSVIGDIVPTFNGTATLLLTKNNYIWSLQTNSVAPGGPLYGHTATMDKSGQLIYYFGGRSIVRDPNTGAYTRPYTTFLDFLVFNTDTSLWESKIASSTVVPSGRMSHTTNLIPNSDTLIIYGGAGPDKIGNRVPVTDYIFTYNTKTNVMQPISIPASPVGAGPRFGHSAIIRKNSLFIIFGVDITLKSNSDFHILNLDTYSWETSFSTLGLASNPADTTPTGGNRVGSGSGGNNDSSSQKDQSNKETNSSGLSSGTIAGIVIGVIALVSYL
ncbi:hypothetical protein BD770DRAFT_72801 [Pilaira anomala]|nr:hypothetical protein BD770DRAFT_72801 [Pilaira anomala]